MNAREKYSSLSEDEIFAKIDELEGKIVDYKKQTKSTKSESSRTIEDLQAQINELKNQNKKSENDDFLKDKNISEDERKIYEEKISKGYDKEDAFLIATKESSKINENISEIWKNDLPWSDFNIGGKEIKYSDLANLSQEEYNNVMDKVDSWEMKVISE